MVSSASACGVSWAIRSSLVTSANDRGANIPGGKGLGGLQVHAFEGTRLLGQLCLSTDRGPCSLQVTDEQLPVAAWDFGA